MSVSLDREQLFGAAFIFPYLILGYIAVVDQIKVQEGPAVYSMDLKTRIFAACMAGESGCQVAKRFKVSSAFVNRMMQRFRETGSFVVLEKEKRGPKFLLTQKHLDKLSKMVTENPGLCAREYRDKLRLDASILTVWRALRRLGFTNKKNGNAR